jgi:hypothetical protein
MASAGRFSPFGPLGIRIAWCSAVSFAREGAMIFKIILTVIAWGGAMLLQTGFKRIGVSDEIAGKLISLPLLAITACYIWFGL